MTDSFIFTDEAGDRDESIDEEEENSRPLEAQSSEPKKEEDGQAKQEAEEVAKPAMNDHVDKVKLDVVVEEDVGERDYGEVVPVDMLSLFKERDPEDDEFDFLPPYDTVFSDFG